VYRDELFAQEEAQKEQLAKAKLRAEYLENARLEWEAQEKTRVEEELRLAPIKAAQQKKKVLAVGTGVMILLAAITIATINRSREIAAKAEADRIEQARFDAEVQALNAKRLQQDEQIKDELKMFFSTGVFFAFKIGENNLDALLIAAEGPTLQGNYHDGYSVECRKNQCQNIFRNSILLEALKSVKFFYCVPDSSAKRDQKDFKMTGFNIEFDEDSRSQKYAEYISKNVSPPNESSKTIQKLNTYFGIGVRSKINQKVDWPYAINDNCGNKRVS
jgi:hypothetical protein